MAREKHVYGKNKYTAKKMYGKNKYTAKKVYGKNKYMANRCTVKTNIWQTDER